MAMAGERELRDMIVETNRDVKWICRTLQRMEEKDAEMEGRLRTLENWQSETTGEEKRERQIAAGAGGVVGGIVAVVVKVMGWG
jgi:chromosome segregation ATPase